MRRFFISLVLLLVIACDPTSARPKEPDVSAPQADTYEAVLEMSAEREVEIDAWKEAAIKYHQKLHREGKADGYFMAPGKDEYGRARLLKEDLWRNCREAEIDYIIIRQEQGR